MVSPNPWHSCVSGTNQRKAILLYSEFNLFDYLENAQNLPKVVGLVKPIYSQRHSYV